MPHGVLLTLEHRQGCNDLVTNEMRIAEAESLSVLVVFPSDPSSMTSLFAILCVRWYPNQKLCECSTDPDL